MKTTKGVLSALASGIVAFVAFSNDIVSLIDRAPKSLLNMFTISYSKDANQIKTTTNSITTTEQNSTKNENNNFEISSKKKPEDNNKNNNTQTDLETHVEIIIKDKAVTIAPLTNNTQNINILPSRPTALKTSQNHLNPTKSEISMKIGSNKENTSIQFTNSDSVAPELNDSRLSGDVKHNKITITSPPQKSQRIAQAQETKLKKGPYSGANTICKLSAGEIVFILKEYEDSDWVWVQVENGGMEGYLQKTTDFMELQ